MNNQQINNSFQMNNLQQMNNNQLSNNYNISSFNPNNMHNNNFNNNINNVDLNMNKAFSQPNIYGNNQNLFFSQNNNNANPIMMMNGNFLNRNNQFPNLNNSNNLTPNNKKPKFVERTKITHLIHLTYVPMIGLNNIGQTCYMNSVLQCLCNLPEITNYFLNPKKEKIIKENNITMSNSTGVSLSIVYKELVEKLWTGIPEVAYSPTNFKKALVKLNSLFKDDQAGDSKDLACYIIMQLHNELNNIDSDLQNKHLNINTQNDDIIVNPYNRDEVYQYFINDFNLTNNSIITKNFYGINQNMYQCQICQAKNPQQCLMKYSYENFFFLEFPLEEVRKFSLIQNMNMGMNYQNQNEVNIYDCFNYYQKQGEMEGYCEKCRSNNANISTLTNILSPPKILMIVCNRGKGLQFNVKINFEMQFTLKNLIKNNDQTYELQSVIKHLEDNSASGHFIAYCRSPIPTFHDNWYCYNDATVVQTKNFNEIVDIGVTYILFYRLNN